jgi:hypothetical protein
VRFATAAMLHLRGVCREVGTPPPIYELYNEPNTVFWGSPSGNASQYSALARALRRSMDAANLSGATDAGGVPLIGPALSGFGSEEGWSYLMELEAAGTLRLFDMISVRGPGLEVDFTTRRLCLSRN